MPEVKRTEKKERPAEKGLHDDPIVGGVKDPKTGKYHLPK